VVNINDIVLFPQRGLAAMPGDFNLDAQELSITNAAGHRLYGWLLCPAGTSHAKARDRGTVIISHGNAGNVGTFLPWAKAVTDPGYEAVLYDYQGYGLSEGTPDVHSLLGDLQAVWDHTCQNGAERVALMGLSLGSLVTIALAVQSPPQLRCVFLEGALIPREELSNKFGPLGAAVAWVLGRQIPEHLHSENQIKHLRHPTFFVHSANDEVTSLGGAQKLHDLATCPKEIWIVPGAGHLEPVTTQPYYSKRLAAFLEAHMTAQPGPDRPPAP
jgi:pimeloyl-ACP methyl ester carboxylesterase